MKIVLIAILSSHLMNSLKLQATPSQKGSYKNLENYDLLTKFLKRANVQKYIQTILKNGKLEGNFNGLYKEIKPDLDALLKRFGLKLIIPTHDLLVDIGSFKLDTKPSTSEDLDIFVPFFFLEFLLYSKSYVKKSKLKAITFVNTLNFSTPTYSQYRAACPEYYKTFSMYYCTKERSTDYIRQVLHHEFFHYVDWTADGTYADSAWEKLNTSGFEYGSGGQNMRTWEALDPSIKGFIDAYSTTGIEEDKAQIMQYLMSTPAQAFKNSDEKIEKKVSYTYNWLIKYDKVGMGSTKNNANLLGKLVSFRNKFSKNFTPSN